MKCKAAICAAMFLSGASSAVSGESKGPRKLSGDKFAGLHLKIDVVSKAVSMSDEISFRAELCNEGKRDVLVYKNTDWGGGRGIRLRVKRPGASDYVFFSSFSHSIVPFGVVYSQDSYVSLEPGKCRKLQLKGPVSTVFSGPGEYHVQGVAVPYPNRSRELSDRVWVLEDGVVESPAIVVRVTK